MQHNVLLLTSRQPTASWSRTVCPISIGETPRITSQWTDAPSGEENQEPLATSSGLLADNLVLATQAAGGCRPQ